MPTKFSKFKDYLYRGDSSDSSIEKLRVCVLLDEERLPKVFAQVLADIEQSEFAEIALVVIKEQPQQLKKNILSKISGFVTWFSDSKTSRKRFYYLYCRFDEWINRKQDLFSHSDLRKELNNKQKIVVKPIQTGFVDRFSNSDLASIDAHKIDVIVRFGFRILRGDILRIPKYGVWSYHHGDNDYYRGAPPHYWELAERAPLSGVTLQILTERLDDGVVIEKGYFTTRQQLSVIRNRLAAYEGSQHFILASLRKLHCLGWERFKADTRPSTPYLGLKPLYKAPTNSELTKWIFRECKEKFKTLLNGRRSRLSFWRIGIRKCTAMGLHKLQGGVELEDFTWIESPAGHFWADPFVVDHNEKSYVFYEDFIYDQNRAVIACAEITDDGSLANNQTILDTKGHASFPFIFEHEGLHYMIPETAGDGLVDLYVADAFPLVWRKLKTLLKLNCVDTVVWRSNNKWWLHTGSLAQHGSVSTALLFSSDSLTGEWKLHPQSPVSSDVRYARNGGRVNVTEDGRVFRISQSSERTYGSAISLHEIETLSDTEFKEKLIFTIKPTTKSGIRGLHTYSASKRFEMIDAVWSITPGDSTLRTTL